MPTSRYHHRPPLPGSVHDEYSAKKELARWLANRSTHIDDGQLGIVWLQLVCNERHHACSRDRQCGGLYLVLTPYQ